MNDSGDRGVLLEYAFQRVFVKAVYFFKSRAYACYFFNAVNDIGVRV